MDKKHVKLRIENSNNEIIEEKEMILNPGDTLIARVPENTTISEMQKLGEFMEKVILGEHQYAVMPNTIDLIVIKKEV